MAVIYISIILIVPIALYKMYFGEVMIRKNSDLESITFEVTESGFYSIWIKGQMLKEVALDTRNTTILEANRNKIKPIKSIFHPQVNRLNKGRTMLKYYYLKKGKFTFEIVKEQEDSLGIFSRISMRNKLSNKSTEFTYEIRKTLPEFIFPILLFGIVFSITSLIQLFQ